MSHQERIDDITDIQPLAGSFEEGGWCMIVLNGDSRRSFSGRLLEIIEIEGVGNVIYFVRGGRVRLARWRDRLTEDNLPYPEATYTP